MSAGERWTHLVAARPGEIAVNRELLSDLVDEIGAGSGEPGTVIGFLPSDPHDEPGTIFGVVEGSGGETLDLTAVPFEASLAPQVREFIRSRQSQPLLLVVHANRGSEVARTIYDVMGDLTQRVHVIAPGS